MFDCNQCDTTIYPFEKATHCPCCGADLSAMVVIVEDDDDPAGDDDSFELCEEGGAA